MFPLVPPHTRRSLPVQEIGRARWGLLSAPPTFNSLQRALLWGFFTQPDSLMYSPPDRGKVAFPMSDIKKSCKECPSFVHVEETRVKLGRALGNAACLKYGYMLGKPGLDESEEARIQEAFAGPCEGYGQPEPWSRPARLGDAVITPDLDILRAVSDPEFEAAVLTTCFECVNFIPAHVVADEFQWGESICGAQGNLLFDVVGAAKECPYASAGANRWHTDGLELAPIYSRAINLKTPVDVWLDSGAGKYIGAAEFLAAGLSDGEVPGWMYARGVRAMRAVELKKVGAEPILLPVYDPSLLSLESQVLVPVTGDDGHPELYVDHMNLLQWVSITGYEEARIPALVGAPGTGKTEFSRFLAWMIGLPFVRISIFEDSQVDDAITAKSRFVQTGTDANGSAIMETVMVKGTLSKWWTQPCVISLDEWNLGNDALVQSVRKFLDNPVVTLDEMDGEVLTRDYHCFLIASMNPSHDFRNIGTKELADADCSRLEWKHVSLPPDNIERAMIVRWCQSADYEIDADTLDKVMQITLEVREMVDQGRIPVSFGVRQSVRFAMHTKYFDLEDAMRCFTDRLDQSVNGPADTILTAVRFK